MAASQSRRFNLISDVNSTRETWRLKVRVIRLYAVPSWINPDEPSRIEMVLLDEKNDKIQASFKDKLIRVFRPLLHEGELYTISNFVVSENKDNLKACRNKWKINFHKNTSIRECIGVEIPKFGFELVSFKDIQEQKPTQNVFIDIIGRLKGKSPIQIVKDGETETKKMKIKLEDECGGILEVQLWGDYVDLLYNHVTAHPGQLVVIIQFAKLKYLGGQSYVSNSFYTSKLLMNLECDAVTYFLARFEKDQESETHLLEELSVSRPTSINEEFSSLTDRRYIADILNIKEPCFCAVVATIKSVDTQHDWCYTSCKICATKAVKKADGSMFCEKCDKRLKYVTTRFKVVFKVEDDSGTASFTLFCREMQQLIQQSATEIRDTLIKNGEDDLFPMEFDDLLQKQFLFKLNITHYNLSNNYKVYTVARITDDPELSSAHFALMKVEEVSDVLTESTGTLPLSILNDNEVVSAIGDNIEMNSNGTCNITPSKRGIEEIVSGELYILNEKTTDSNGTCNITPSRLLFSSFQP